MAKYIFFTGGVVSGLGKGITAASLGSLIKARGYSVKVLRFNPYFNIDSFNLSPGTHGEIYITEDGRACDLVVGHYERILSDNLYSDNDVTSGEIYSLVISNERQNAYNGATVQVVPHITDEIKKRVLAMGQKGVDLVIVEMGGTVGDIEAQPFMEAIRQLKRDLGKNNVAYVHVSLVNYIDVSGEQKTKPTQHSVKELQNLGIQPDVIVCRSDYPLEAGSRNKLSLFCNVDKDCIIENLVTENLYEIPLKLEKEGFCRSVLRHLRIEDKAPDLRSLEELCRKINNPDRQLVKIGVVGKFASRVNAHISLRQALILSGAYEGVKTEFIEICSSNVDLQTIKGLDGLIITEGVDIERSNGKALALEYCKNNNLPLLMIDKACLLAVDAPINTKIPISKQGVFKTKIAKGTMLYDIYKSSCSERHSHRFLFNKEYFEDSKEFTISGISALDDSVDAFELKGHRFFMGVLFRPEFSVKSDKPNKLISAFIRAMKDYK